MDLLVVTFMMHVMVDNMIIIVVSILHLEKQVVVLDTSRAQSCQIPS